MSVALVVSYGLMVLSQSKGPVIIELLHGPAARRKAEALPPVEPESAHLCEDYEAAHFDAISDILHTCGMLSAVVLLLLALRFGWKRRIRTAAWIPPAYYLPAWAGHFLFQQDIPAVFSYGTTFRGWVKGEYCSYLALLAGRTIQKPADWVPTIVLTSLMVLAILWQTRRNGRDRSVRSKQKKKS